MLSYAQSSKWDGMNRYARPEAILARAIQEISIQYDAHNTRMCITEQNISVRDKISCTDQGCLKGGALSHALSLSSA